MKMDAGVPKKSSFHQLEDFEIFANSVSFLV
jgi:hypothetical protein